MPELPEVETIRRSLKELIGGKRITTYFVFQPIVFKNYLDFDPTNCVVKDIRRRGKYLLFDLEHPVHGKALMMVHLRMTGKLLYGDKEESIAKHTHIRFEFTDHVVDFNDIRRFGRVEFLPTNSEGSHPSLTKLGPEPTFATWQFSDFYQRCQKRCKASIKSVILDQTVVAGLGNIYADEALFRAGIHPAKPVGNISSDELKQLYNIIPPLLEEAIGFRGTSFRDYVDGLGKKGEFQLHLRVYQRNGQNCDVCGTTIEKCRVAGRGTHFCPHCQK